MAASIGETLESLPPWVAPVAIVGVVLLATLRSNGSGAGGSTGGVTTFTPVPADPNLTALAAHEADVKLGAFDAVAQLYGTENVSNIAAARDTAISNIQAGMDRARTAAALEASLASTHAAESVGLATVNAQLASALDTNSTNRTVSLAELQSQTDIARINANGAVAVAGTQENARKSESKNNMVSNVVSTVGHVISGALHFFGL